MEFSASQIKYQTENRVLVIDKNLTTDQYLFNVGVVKEELINQFLKILKEVNANKVAIVFGREDAGLNNDELQLGHFHVQIPAEENCSSLNLAAAVLVICYELYKLSLRSNSKELIKDQDHWDQKLATNGEVEYFYKHLERVMIAIDFHDPENPRQLIQRVRRLFNRIRIDVMEMNILRGILSNVENAINKKEN